MPIVSTKKVPEQVHFRLQPDLLSEIRGISERTNRSLNEVVELLLWWAVNKEREELEKMGEGSAGRRKAQ